MELMENEYSKKQVKTAVNRVTWAVIVNLLIMNVVVMVGVIIRIVVETVSVILTNTPEEADIILEGLLMDDAFWRSMAESAVEYLIAVPLGLLFTWLILRKRFADHPIFISDNQMTKSGFVKCLCVFMGLQMPFMLLNGAVEWLLNLVGYTAMAGVESATAGSVTVSMFLYAGFGAPIGEELLYRGFIMRSLQRYGKNFAIVISAILFGLMHTNLAQSFFAMGVGLVLGYVAMNYSLKWAILLHFINNCIFGDVVYYLLKPLPETTQDVIEIILFVAFFLVGVIVLIKERFTIKEFVKQNRSTGTFYKYAFTTIVFIVSVICLVAAGMLYIEKL